MPKLLIVDDEPKLTKLLARQLSSLEGWTVDTANSVDDALQCLRQTPFDLVLSDIKMPNKDGLDLLRLIKQSAPQPDVILMTAYAAVGTAVEALRLGAYDYLLKPLQQEELQLVLSRWQEHRGLQEENKRLKKELDSQRVLVGKSDCFQQVFDKIDKVARTSTTVLICGASGTGKELVAHRIHNLSPRVHQPFIKANCGAIPEGLLESELFGHKKGAFTGAVTDRVGRFQEADGGTILLDEIGDLPLNLQVKLLRVLQERQFEPVGSSETITVDVRVLAATHRQLEQAIAQGEFREDLYYRLHVVCLELPLLRERVEDIELLAEHFIQKIARREGLPMKNLMPETVAVLKHYGWHGNVRELENAMEHALVMGTSPQITPEDLPSQIHHNTQHKETPVDANSPPDPASASLDEMEAWQLAYALKTTNGNQTEAARKLGITRRALNYRRQKYGL